MGNPLYGDFKIRKGENLELYPNLELAKKILNWESKITFELALKNLINYYRTVKMKNLITQKVSVIMNVHNGEEFITEAIYSVINQTYQNWELIVWDNYSTDNTYKIVKSFKDKRIIYFKSDVFDKLYTARNKAIDVSNGDLITFLDADDIWLPNKLEEQSNIMQDNEIDFAIQIFSNK